MIMSREGASLRASSLARLPPPTRFDRRFFSSRFTIHGTNLLIDREHISSPSVTWSQVSTMMVRLITISVGLVADI